MSSPARKGVAPGPQIIVKRRTKRAKGGHHGGSWKVAYADFVTAMMAFFLLLWLLGSTSQEEREAVSSYFKRPLKEVIMSGMYAGGDRVIAVSSESLFDSTLAPGSLNAIDGQNFNRLQTRIEEEISADTLLDALRDQIRIEITEDGMRIQLVDTEDRPMFDKSSADPQPHARRILAKLAPLIEQMSTKLLISGHTDATPFASESDSYGNWELSADRANAARRLLVASGVSESKVLRVDGHASTVLLPNEDPYDAHNRRISLYLLSESAIQEEYAKEYPAREAAELVMRR